MKFQRSTMLKADEINAHLNPETCTSIPYRVAAGVAQVTIPATGVGSVTVTLPAGRFTTAPVVTITPRRSSPSGTVPTIQNVGTTGFTIYAEDTYTFDVTIDVHWIAVQMTPTSAGG